MPISINIKTNARSEMKDITSLVSEEIYKSGIKDGIAVVYVPHTTAGVTINEGADPDVCHDIINKLDQLIPFDKNYRHMEENSDSHIKTLLTGSSSMIMVENGRPVLGTWQKIFFCEYDGPRSRKIFLKILGHF